MHPHVKFFDGLASKMDQVDPKISTILCGIRDQIDAHDKASSAGRLKMGNQNAKNSVIRSVNSLMDRHGEKYPELRRLLGRFVQKVNETGTLI